MRVFESVVSAGAGLRDHDPDLCQEQHERADQVKDGLHQIRRRKGADLTSKTKKWTEEARGAAHPEGSLLWEADFVEIGWL